MTTNSAGQKIAELRYKAWGEVRYTSGTPTKYTYTGQYSNMADFGLMFYNARWYDVALGRFAQADTIVPGGVQGLDRYAYVGNDPPTYSDPDGHCRSDYICRMRALKRELGDPGDEPNWEEVLGAGYSDWEVELLERLYSTGGTNAQYGVNFILSHQIHITVKSGWQSGFGTRGAWYEGSELIVLNGSLKNPDGSSVYSLDNMPDAWGLANVIHEARHIEQGSNIAFSKFGEMDAWQIGIDVADHLGYYATGWNKRDAEVLKAQTVDAFSEAIQDYDKGYWNALYNNPLGQFMCVGLCSLPDWPRGVEF